jgi:hypothetical protein
MKKSSVLIFIISILLALSCDKNPGNIPFYIGNWIPDYAIAELYDSTNLLISSDTIQWGTDTTLEAFISFSNTLFSEYLYFQDDTVYYVGNFSYSVDNGKLIVPFIDSIVNEQGFYSSLSYFVEKVNSYLLFTSTAILKAEYVIDFGFSKYISYNYYDNYSGTIPPSNWPNKSLPITDIMSNNKKYFYYKRGF